MSEHGPSCGVREDIHARALMQLAKARAEIAELTETFKAYRRAYPCTAAAALEKDTEIARLQERLAAFEAKR
jgi:hypothetical protein